MSPDNLKKISQKPHVLVLAGIVLSVGLFALVLGLSERQDVRSRAAAGGCDNVLGDIEADNCQISGNVVGNIKGSNNNITGNVYGFIIGDFNTIGVNVGKSIIGNSNSVGNNVYGCVAGNNNTIENNVSGSMTGTGNSARQVANLPCPPLPSNPPSQPPTQPPTIGPSITITQPPSNPPSQPPSNPPSQPPTNPPTQPPTLPPSQPPHGTCDDNIDNNQNIVIDEDDPICHTDGNANNPDSYDPRRNEGYSPTQPPTITHPPGTSLSLTVFMHGIGSSGDNVNPNDSSLSNKNPVRTSRLADVFIYDSNNQLVASTSGAIRYNSANGNYTGVVRTENSLSSGIYNIRIGADQHLTRLIPTIQTIMATGTNVLPPVSLVAGDIIRDNAINILDYNILIGCYDDAPSPVCKDAAEKTAADIDDNGAVNGADYNLFLREILTQPGQ